MNRNRGIRHYRPRLLQGEYWRDNERFADLFNATLFGGHGFIKATDLEEREPGSAGEDCRIKKEMIRGVKYSQKLKVNFVILDLCQQDVLLHEDAKHEGNESPDIGFFERESDIDEERDAVTCSQMDRGLPVITICLYRGDETGAPDVNVQEVLEMLRIPRNMRSHIDDYKLIMLDVQSTAFRFQCEHNRLFFEMRRPASNTKMTDEEDSSVGKGDCVRQGIQERLEDKNLTIGNRMVTIV